mmetsp:Transcript_1170/g.2606  ORF Transcript_1170/g.2606 Transcript_1170/m.2606 type:complete len:280 (+) Transcript_1170:1588-2427(+)
MLTDADQSESKRGRLRERSSICRRQPRPKDHESDDVHEETVAKHKPKELRGDPPEDGRLGGDRDGGHQNCGDELDQGHGEGSTVLHDTLVWVIDVAALELQTIVGLMLPDVHSQEFVGEVSAPLQCHATLQECVESSNRHHAQGETNNLLQHVPILFFCLEVQAVLQLPEEVDEAEVHSRDDEGHQHQAQRKGPGPAARLLVCEKGVGHRCDRMNEFPEVHLFCRGYHRGVSPLLVHEVSRVHLLYGFVCEGCTAACVLIAGLVTAASRVIIAVSRACR